MRIPPSAELDSVDPLKPAATKPKRAPDIVEAAMRKMTEQMPTAAQDAPADEDHKKE